MKTIFAVIMTASIFALVYAVSEVVVFEFEQIMLFVLTGLVVVQEYRAIIVDKQMELLQLENDEFFRKIISELYKEREKNNE